MKTFSYLDAASDALELLDHARAAARASHALVQRESHAGAATDLRFLADGVGREGGATLAVRRRGRRHHAAPAVHGQGRGGRRRPPGSAFGRKMKGRPGTDCEASDR